MNEWTDAEMSILIEHGSRKTDEELALALPGRTVFAIAKKRQLVGIFKHPDPDFLKADRIGRRKEQPRPLTIKDLAPSQGKEISSTSVLALFLSHADNYDIKTLERTRDVLAKHIDRKIKNKILLEKSK